MVTLQRRVTAADDDDADILFAFCLARLSSSLEERGLASKSDTSTSRHVASRRRRPRSFFISSVSRRRRRRTAHANVYEYDDGVRSVSFVK